MNIFELNYDLLNAVLADNSLIREILESFSLKKWVSFKYYIHIIIMKTVLTIQTCISTDLDINLQCLHTTK